MKYVRMITLAVIPLFCPRTTNLGEEEEEEGEWRALKRESADTDDALGGRNEGRKR